MAQVLLEKGKENLISFIEKFTGEKISSLEKLLSTPIFSINAFACLVVLLEQ